LQSHLNANKELATDLHGLKLTLRITSFLSLTNNLFIVILLLDLSYNEVLLVCKKLEYQKKRGSKVGKRCFKKEVLTGENRR